MRTLPFRYQGSSKMMLGCGTCTSVNVVPNSKAKILEKKDIAKTKFLRFVDISYISPSGKTSSWQSVERSNSKAGRVDAVCMFTVMKSKHRDPQLLLIKQFRPPLGRFTIEMPAGLVDEGETAEQAALRELKEESGYSGVVRSTSGAQFVSPGLTNENLATLVVEIDMDLPEHQQPPAQDELDAGNIERVVVPLTGLYQTLQKLESEGFAVHGLLYSLAHGMQLGDVLQL